MLWTSRPRHANESKDGPNNLFHHAKKKIHISLLRWNT